MFETKKRSPAASNSTLSGVEMPSVTRQAAAGGFGSAGFAASAVAAGGGESTGAGDTSAAGGGSGGGASSTGGGELAQALARERRRVADPRSFFSSFMTSTQ